MAHRILLSFCVLLVLAAACCAQTADIQRFYYDDSKPLDIRENETQVVDSIAIHDLSYASPLGGRVPAYLVVPPVQGRMPAVIFLHWGFGDRSEFLAEAMDYAREGAMSLLIDASRARPELQFTDDFNHPEPEHDSYVHLVTDLRRGVDLLWNRPDVDRTRIAYVGHSLGATWGGVLAGIDHRPKAFVLMGGLPTLTDFSGDDAYSKAIRNNYSPQVIANRNVLIRQIDPELYIGLATAPIFFQFGRFDSFITPVSGNRYFNAAKEPKRIAWYETSHDFNDDQSRHDREQFIAEQLALKPIPGLRASPPATTFGTPAYQPGPGIAAPRIVFRATPAYPPGLRKQKIEGSVRLSCIIDANGNVTDVHVIQSLHPELDKAAADALRSTTFQPGTRNGQPVPVQIEMEYPYPPKS